MEQEEQALKQLILNKPLTAIEFYNSEQGYVAIDDEHTWVIDAGVQLGFGDTLFSFAWNSGKEQFEHHYGKVEALTEGMEIGGLDATAVPRIQALIGQHITAVDIAWNWYSELDENYEPTEEKHYIPMGILLQFSGGSTLQLAAVRYKVEMVNRVIQDAIYDSERDLLVSVDKVIDIRTVDDTHLFKE